MAVKLGIRWRAGHHIHVAVDVQDIYVACSLARTNQCLSQSLWHGKNRRLTWLTVQQKDGRNSKPKHTTVYSNIPSTMDPAWKRARRQTRAFMFQCGSWFPGTNCTSSYIAVWTWWSNERSQSFENSGRTLGFLPAGTKFVTAKC